MAAQSVTSCLTSTLINPFTSNTHNHRIYLRYMRAFVEVVLESTQYILQKVVFSIICLSAMAVLNYWYFVSNLQQIQHETDHIVGYVYLFLVSYTHFGICVLVPLLVVLDIVVFKCRDIVIIMWGDFTIKSIENPVMMLKGSEYAATPFGRYTAHNNASRWNQEQCPICITPFAGGGRLDDVLYCGHRFCYQCLEDYESAVEGKAWRENGVRLSGHVWRTCPVCKCWYDTDTMRYPREQHLHKGYFSRWVDYKNYGL